MSARARSAHEGTAMRADGADGSGNCRPRKAYLLRQVTSHVRLALDHAGNVTAVPAACAAPPPTPSPRAHSEHPIDDRPPHWAVRTLRNQDAA